MSEGTGWMEDFDEIVGRSASLKGVLENVKTVAPTGANVLILGESGTGKELVAHAIHRLSLRNNAPFIKANCAAFPSELLESELFGHEKGAFTHALTQKVGRLELANHGTFLLDEIGELPLQLQPKLLHVLQEQEFQRLGGTSNIRVNVRFIAATNQDLARSVAEGRFRTDLFYRLNVFPIQVPPLRERASDIPLLIDHFVQKFAWQMNKRIETVPGEVLTTVVKYQWPGNVRELEHFIQRAVILTKGSVLQAPLAELESASALFPEAPGTLISKQREHILKVLRETRGVVSGPDGAAARLGVKRTTLQSMMRRLGITRGDFLDS